MFIFLDINGIEQNAWKSTMLIMFYDWISLKSLGI